MLLTDEEIHEAIKSAKQVDHNYAGWVKDQRIEFGKAVQAAILAKLASAELPTNAPHITRRIRACESEVPALVVFEHAWRQAYAQGAASQLAEKPMGYFDDDGNFEDSYKDWMKDDAGAGWQAVYTRRQV